MLEKKHIWTQFNSDTNASNTTYFERNTRKKEETFFLRKNKWKKRKKNNEKHESEVNLKWAHSSVPPPRSKNQIFKRKSSF